MGVDQSTEFDGMYQRHRPLILAYCLRRAPFSDATDATSQVFTTAWRRRNEMPTGEEALPWLYGVARKVLSNHWRGERRRANLMAKAQIHRAPPPLTPDEVLVEHEDYVRVRVALSRLKSLDREVLLLSAWEGLSHAEMATALNVSLVAVDQRLVRAKKRLARQYVIALRSHGSSVSAARKGGEAR